MHFYPEQCVCEVDSTPGCHHTHEERNTDHLALKACLRTECCYRCDVRHGVPPLLNTKLTAAGYLLTTRGKTSRRCVRVNSSPVFSRNRHTIHVSQCDTLPGCAPSSFSSSLDLKGSWHPHWAALLPLCGVDCYCVLKARSSRARILLVALMSSDYSVAVFDSMAHIFSLWYPWVWFGKKILCYTFRSIYLKKRICCNVCVTRSVIIGVAVILPYISQLNNKNFFK